jgi:hypothetical protein
MTDTLTPERELAGYREQRIAGAMSAADYFTHVERLAPQIADPSSARPRTGQEQARVQIAELRQQRIAGQIGEREYLEQIEKLGPTAHPETAVTTEEGTTMTVSPEVAAEMERAMSPPDSPERYVFDYAGELPDTPEAHELDAHVRQAFHDFEVPQRFAGYMHDSAIRLAKQFEHASPDERRAHCDSVMGSLEKRWGDQFQVKLDGVLDLLAKVPGPLGDAIEAAPWIVADALIFEQLADLVRHRARRA